MSEKKAKMKSEKKDTLQWIVVAVQTALTVTLMFFVRDILPVKYIGMVGGALAVLLLLVVGILFLGVKRRKKQGKGKLLTAFGILLSLLISVGLVSGTVVINQGLSTLDNITEGQYQTHVVSLIVLTDGPDSVAEMDGKTVGIVTGLDSENVGLALDDISTAHGTTLSRVSYASILEAGLALLADEVDSILINEAYRGLIADNNADFESSTKVIYTYEYQEELESIELDLDVTSQSFNVVISGIDTYGPVSTVSRSDVNMIVTVNPVTKTILMTSIPRDYYVELASFGAYDKLTHAGVFGIEETMDTLAELFGIEIDYYAKVNFSSLIKIVDALGGITVENPRAFKGFAAGDIQLNGKQALTFCRERYSFSDGDNERIKNQQRVLTGIIEKAMSSAVIKNYTEVLEAVSESCVTNMTSDEIQSLIQMQLRDMSSWNIEHISVTGSNSSSTSCYAMPGYNLYVMRPHMDSVASAAQNIEEVFDATS